MGLDFTKFNANAQDSNANVEVQTAVQQPMQEIVPAEYNITVDREQLTQKLVNSEEVDKLVSTIEVHNMNSIVTFGAEAAEEISKASDTVLNSLNMNEINETNKLMTALANIMSKFDVEELKENPSLFGKLFGKVREEIDKLLEKYTTMGSEIDKIYIQLKKYDDEIRRSNIKLNTMFEANVNYYHELVKYILAGEQACNEMQEYINAREKELAETGNNEIRFELQSLNQSLLMMEQRVQDLRTAENVALQSVPMLKTMEFSNYNLIRKINSAFIITLPVFKQALAQAILLKRQRIQADSMAALDAKTNELLLKNADNTVQQSKLIAKMASGSSIQVDTLEKTWQTIVNGIDETKRIELEARKQREVDKQRLENIKNDFNKRFIEAGNVQ
ncbi:MAG TPA: hypothetical protein DCG28_06785 [Lachnospiraceae bacterium]|nr:hypothetical protein [Lachnospiraceae bacterium]